MATQSPILDALSESQRAAAAYTDGHQLVLAGAGSGKTRMLTHRIAHLLIDHAVDPHRILAVTFTNKAAREMRERVGHLLGGEAPRNLWISTFHSLGARLLRLHPEAAGLQQGFTIFDDTDQKRVVRRIYKERGIDSQRLPVGGTVAAIGTWKSRMLAPDEVESAEAFADHIRIQVYGQYQEELRKQNAVDFSDLIVLPVKILGEIEEVGERYRRRFHHVMVDEYQDTDRGQYLFIRAMVGPQTKLCAVGDEDQSIYGWRGAEIRNILDFQEDFPDVRVQQLDKNYRCPDKVLDAANQMISHNRSRLKEREVWSDKRRSHRPGYFLAETAEQEAQWIVEGLSWMRMEEGFDNGDCAIFYRTHAQARTIEEALLRRGVPYKVFGGLKFFERKAIKDLICYLRLLVNVRDRDSLLRVINEPKRGIGPKRVEKLMALANETGRAPLEILEDPKALGGKAGKAGAEFAALLAGIRDQMEGKEPAEVLRELVTELGYNAHLIATQRGDDMELVDELANSMVDYAMRAEEPSVRGFLEESALVSPTDELEDGSGQVSLMTLHNAKGLEFPLVFLTGLEEGLLPHGNSFGMDEELEEERRLFYVGMTRTMERLFLSGARFRTIHGSRNFRPPSRFLEEIGGDLLDVGGEDL